MDTLSTQPNVAPGRKTRHKTRWGTRDKTQTKDLTREPRTQDPKVTQRHKTGHKTHSPTVAQEPLRGDTWSGTPEVHNSQLLHKKHHMFIVQAGCP